MGTWGTGIKENDFSADVYLDFFEKYNQGEEPEKILQDLKRNYKSDIENSDEENNFWLVMALALWETKSLNTPVFNIVKEIINSKSDIELWKNLDASNEDLIKREAVLNKLLFKISNERKQKKSRKQKAKRKAIFEKGSCLTFKLKNGNYGGAIVLEKDDETGDNLILTTRINQISKPTLQHFYNSEVLILNFSEHCNGYKYNYYSNLYYNEKYKGMFEIVSVIDIERNYKNLQIEDITMTANWSFIISNLENQLKFEETNERPKAIFSKTYYSPKTIKYTNKKSLISRLLSKFLTSN